MASNRVAAIPMTIYDASGLKGAWEVVHPGLPEQLIYIRYYNDSDIVIKVSYDGSTAHDILIDGTNHTVNFQTNSEQTNRMCVLAKGTKIYMYGAQGTGNVYIVGYYNY